MYSLKPSFGIVFYISENNDVETKTYAEKFNIDNNGLIGSMEALSKDTFSDLANKFLTNKSQKPKRFFFKGVIPTKVKALSIGGDNLLLGWIVRSQLKPFKTSSINSELIYPHMYFVLKNSSLFCYALKTANLTDKTILYKLPLPNFYNDNRMCMGTMSLKNFIQSDLEKTMDAIENMFFNSNFNDYLRKDSYKGNAEITLDKCLKARKIVNKLLDKTKYVKI